MKRAINTAPIPTVRSVWPDNWKGLTSIRAGQIVPVAFFPLLREDRARGRVEVQVRMAEAIETIVNPIRVRVQAWLVPKLALARFNGSYETLNRSYTGELMPDGGNPPPWFVEYPLLGPNEILNKLGVHYDIGMRINSDLIEAYNRIVQWQRKEVSPSLSGPDDDNSQLMPEFWDDPKWSHVKPSFDAALMEGAIPVGLDGGHVAVQGLGISPTPPGAGSIGMRQSGGHALGGLTGWRVGEGYDPAAASNTDLRVVSDPERPGYPKIYVDLSGQGASISLANFEVARQTRAFAKLREMFDGLSDQYLVDLLMQGINVPPEEWRQPVKVGEGVGYINQTERYATDASNLDVSVTNGLARVGLTINTPAVNPGGMIVVTCSVVPEQLYERQEDPYLSAMEVDELPNYLRDFLDPQKVDLMANSRVDLLHSDADGIFGYEPLNHRWRRDFARVGGKFTREVDDAFKEDRGRIWAVEKLDPTLSEDFYQCPVPFPHTPFADANDDPFEVLVVGRLEISGLTVQGGHFEEDSNAFERVAAAVEAERLTGDPVQDAAGVGVFADSQSDDGEVSGDAE